MPGDELHAIILALLLVLTATTAHAAPAFVIATGEQIAASASTTAINTTGATLLVACLTTQGPVFSFADNKGNIWIRDVGPLSIDDTTTIWHSVPTSVGSGHTFSVAGPTGLQVILVAGFSGITAGTMERTANQQQSNLTSGAAISSTSTTTTLAADQVVIGCSQLNTNASFAWTATGGATLAASNGAGNIGPTGALSYQIVSTPGTQAATFTATAAGSALTAVATYKNGVQDTQPPTTPTGLNATTVSSSQINLAWVASTDNVGVCAYIVRRCAGAACAPSTIVGNPSSNSYTDLGLTAGTLYRYTVQADDCGAPPAGVSGQSSVAEATTLALTECNVAWTAPVGGTTPTSYELRRCDGPAPCPPLLVLTTVTAPATTYKDSVCPQPVTCYDVDACAAGSCSAFVTFACVTTPAQTTPVLSVSPPSLTFATTVGGSDPASKSLTVSNGTASSMSWTVGDDQAWINEAPSSGTNTTVVTVSVSIAGLTAGTYQSNITVTAPGATNSPIVVPVTLNLSPAVTPTTGRGGRVR